MAKKLSSKLKTLSSVRKEKIKRRAQDLVTQEMSLRDLRKALELTQNDLSSKLHIKQEAVSRIERRSDLLLSTLSSYIEAMGGELSIVAKFPRRPAIKVTGFEEITRKKQDR